MADTLTQLIAKVQPQLLDNGTLFTAATCTAAARQALRELNARVPENATVTIATIAGQKEYELTDNDAAALDVLSIYLEGSNEFDTAIPYDAYVEDSRVFFRLRDALPAGKTMQVHYTKPHTISGLDGSLDSTLPDPLNVAIINGICAYACQIRAAATIESNNVQTNVSQSWAKCYNAWHNLFAGQLKEYRNQRTVVGEPSAAAWNDPQHSDEYP